MKRRTAVLLFVVGILALAAIACSTPNPLVGQPLEATGKVYGFWNGLWDGMTATFSFFASLFGVNWGIYEVHNNGAWYNFGYLLGVGAFAAGGGISIKASSRR